jgi:hypothetical protein
MRLGIVENAIGPLVLAPQTICCAVLSILDFEIVQQRLVLVLGGKAGV